MHFTPITYICYLLLSIGIILQKMEEVRIIPICNQKEPLMVPTFSVGWQLNMESVVVNLNDISAT